LGFVLCDATSPARRHAALEAVGRCEQSARQGGYQPIELEALLIRSALLGELGVDASAPRSAAGEMATRLGAIGTKRDVCRVLKRVLHAPTAGCGDGTILS
jgi:hypothetical protein